MEICRLAPLLDPLTVVAMAGDFLHTRLADELARKCYQDSRQGAVAIPAVAGLL